MSETAATEHRRELEAGVEETWAAIGAAAEQWGAELEREEGTATLSLPVAAGLRHGLASARIEVDGTRARSTLTLSLVEAHYRLHKTGFAMLSLSGAGALITVICPFFPALLPFLPVGILLAVSGWLLVVARLRMSGLDDFVTSVETILDAERGE